MMIKQVASKIYKKFLYRYQSDSETYIKWLRKKGVEIGEGTIFFTPSQCMIDVTRPWLISIGKNVQFASGNTMILTHGYDWSVLKAVYGDVLGSAGGGIHWRQCFYWCKCNNP